MEKYKNPSRSVSEEVVRERKFWKRNQLWTILLAVVVLLFGLLGGSGHSVAPGATELMLTMHDGSTVTVAYDKILSATLLEQVDFGTAVAGRQTRLGKSGTWEHPSWGSYTLCVYASCDPVIQIHTEDHCYVVNLPSAEETRQLYQLIADKLPASK